MILITGKPLLNLTHLEIEGVDAALDVIGAAADRFMDDAVADGSLGIAIPVMVSGKVFFDLPGAGRIGVPFGPFETTWQVQ